MLKTSALRSTTTTTDEDATRTTREKEAKNEKEKEKEREKEKELSNLFRASTSRIGSELDLALETGRVEVSLERSVREERFARVRLVGGWGCGDGGALGRLGGAPRGRMGFKYDPRALHEAIFGGAVGGGVKRRKVESAEESRDRTLDRGKDTREGGREDVVLLAEDGAGERVVFVYRGVTTVDKDKDKSTTANPSPGIGSKRPREEEQDDEYGAVYDIFRERRVGARRGQATGAASSAAGTTTTAASAAPAVSEGTTTKGVRFAVGSKVADGGGRPQRRRRLKAGTGTGGASGGGGDGKVVWRRTLVMRNVSESDVDFGRDGVCLWIRVAPPAANTTSSASTTATSTSTTTPASTTGTATAPATGTATATAAAASEKEPRLTRLEVAYDGKTRTARTKDERRGVVFPCKVWRWRPPPRITHIRAQKDADDNDGLEEGEVRTMDVDA